MTMNDLEHGQRVRYLLSGRAGTVRFRECMPVVHLDNGDSYEVAPDGEVRPCDLEPIGGAS
jgi:hypothetical protein